MSNEIVPRKKMVGQALKGAAGVAGGITLFALGSLGLWPGVIAGGVIAAITTVVKVGELEIEPVEKDNKTAKTFAILIPIIAIIITMSIILPMYKKKKR